MKKFLSVLMALALLFGLTAPTAAYAAEEEGVTIYSCDAYADNVLDDYQTNHGLYDEISGHYGLKPADSTLGDASITFCTDTEVAGRYLIEVFYASSSDGRQFGYQVNDGEEITATVASTGDWKVHSIHTLYANLEAGENDFVISTPASFAEGTKTPNIYGIRYTLKEAAAPVAETVTLYADEADYAHLYKEEIGYEHGMYEEEHGYMTLRGEDGVDENGQSCFLNNGQLIFEVEVETAGRYLIEVDYTAKTGSAKRMFGFAVNGSDPKQVELETAADWKVEYLMTHKEQVMLKAGKNTIVLWSPASYDNKEVKTPNIYAIKYTLKEAAKTPTTPEEIVEAAFALEKGAALDGEYTLTGEIVKIKTPYSEQYKNIEVIIKVLDKEILCYRLKGEGADTLAVGDTITVTGKIKNYNGTVEFDANCALGEVVKAPFQGGYLGRANSYDWGTNGHANAVFSFVSTDETATASTILGQPAGTFGWWYAYVLEYNEANGTFVVTVADNVMDGVNAIETATLGYGKLAFMFHGDFANTDPDTFNYFLEKATVGTEFYLVGDYDVIGATWDVLADTYLTTVKPEKYWTKPVELPTTPEEIVNATYELEDGKYLADKASFTLTGVVTSTTYNEKYGDATTYIVVNGMTDKPLMCYQLKGDVANLKEGDIITVTGPLKNYKGTYEFERPTLDKVESATPDKPVVEGTEYVVKKGDTLSAIAAACGATVKELAELNKIEDPDVIVTGVKLVIPTFEVKRHIVVKGDTLSKIAKDNGCKVADLVKLNNIADPDVIVIGDVIVLP